MKYTIVKEIPDGKYCVQPNKIGSFTVNPCPFLVGDMHSICFVTGEDLYDEDEGTPKSEKCPTKEQAKAEESWIWVAREPCGCVEAASVDDQSQSDLSNDIFDWVKRGLAITHEKGHVTLGMCPAHLRLSK